MNASTAYSIALTDNANGAVAADAVWVVPVAANSDKFAWTPTIPTSGSYDVYARWVAASANAGAADYVVTHASGTSTVSVNQKQNGGQWVKLGTYSFTPLAGHKIELLGSHDGRVVADSIRLVAAGAGASNLVYIHADHLGSPQKMTDGTQALVWDAQFDPFGEEVSIAGSATHPTRFPGQYADPETGFSYNYFRDYDPTIGRYLQSDPIGLVGGLNTYLYVRANPLVLTDPTGEAAWVAPVVVGAGVGGAIDLVTQLYWNDWEWACVDWWEVAAAAGIGGATGLGGYWYKIGKEFKIGKHFRFAPFGNRGPNRWNWPHYHRRPSGEKPPAGQSFKRHRPWQDSPFDKSWWDRF
jgi:RHS repeat-associated protein